MDNDIIIIDDKIEEVDILIREFSKNKIPIKYFNGEIEDLPTNHKFSPKLVFLDLYLDSVRDSKTVFSRCIGILETLLHKNLDYILCIWTSNITEYKTDPELCEDKFNTVLKTKGISPIKIILLEDKNISLESKELSQYTKDLIQDHSGLVFKMKARGKILELALEIEKELDKWIVKNIIHDDEKLFYTNTVLNANILDFMKKFKILRRYYELDSNKDKLPKGIKLKEIDEIKITFIRNAFAHQEINEEKITLMYSKPKQYNLDYQQLIEWIDFFKEQKEILEKFNINSKITPITLETN